ncbi:MAG TPA: hypothetical protein VI564_08105 [Candidatus Nanoarchaeia archaeon]|nr:hypothetical protein [Candidatus Nanoarchaeia archaeon]
MEKEKIRHYLVVFGSAFLFLAFGIWELIDPMYWAGFVPPFMSGFLDAKILVLIHGIVLTVLGVWLVIGKWMKYASIVGALVMAQIIVELIVSSGFTDLFVRDFAILLFVLSLYFEESK